jgi:hypothetical protein
MVARGTSAVVVVSGAVLELRARGSAGASTWCMRMPVTRVTAKRQRTKISFTISNYYTGKDSTVKFILNTQRIEIVMK